MNSKLSSDPRISGAQGTNQGLILLDSSLNPVYCSPEALRIFAYPDQPPQSPGNQFLESIHLLVGKNKGPNGFVTKTTHFMSGKRLYLCRTLVLEPEPNGNANPAIALILERERSILSDLATRFQLSAREIEAVQHLADGLTSKEIARRMNVSPNTVKVFLRLIMRKMGVTTRSGVIGKLISGDLAPAYSVIRVKVKAET